MNAGTDPTPEDVETALDVLEKVLDIPSNSERDTRIKRRIRVEMRRILAAASTED